MARQFIYHMSGLTRAYNGKKVLENLHLSFYPDAKIGILGPNGSGKSTVLRIMAGMDKEWTGEAWLADGATCGYLPQEPQLEQWFGLANHPHQIRLGKIIADIEQRTAILLRHLIGKAVAEIECGGMH